jgi:hypothetical protein
MDRPVAVTAMDEPPPSYSGSWLASPCTSTDGSSPSSSTSTSQPVMTKASGKTASIDICFSS